MISRAIPAAFLFAATPAMADAFPSPTAASPRIQSVKWKSGEQVILTALPQTTLTVMLEPGETIRQAVLSRSNTWDVVVSAETDSFQLTPQPNASPAELNINTNSRSYSFALEVGTGLMAAYLVRFDFQEEAAPAALDEAPRIEGLDWSYRLRGDREVRPLSIRDNGEKTVIEYAEGQSLPAVFAIGPTGDEEVVDGYMRDGKFVIDRIHEELVFRIDKEKATARRNNRRNGAE